MQIVTFNTKKTDCVFRLWSACKFRRMSGLGTGGGPGFAAGRAGPYDKLPGVKTMRVVSLCVAGAVVLGGNASAQTYEAVGSRAAGMGGAFVATADDASATYWNPGALASGAFFSLVLDYNGAKATPESTIRAGSESAAFLGVAMPAFGLSYYRLRATNVIETAVPVDRLDVPRTIDGLGVRVSSLITHHGGITLVQSLTDNIAVGTTLKLVRGVAASGFVPPADSDELLDAAENLVGSAENEFDADIGVLATYGTLRLGLTARNVGEPEFDVPGGDPLRLDRQVRIGAALTLAANLLAALDVDLTKNPGTTGEMRNLAAGAEARIARRAFVRGGFRFNTLGDQPDGRTPVGTAGASYAVFGSMLVEGAITFGSDSAARGWGVGARVVF